MEKKVLGFQGNVSKLNQKVLKFDEFVKHKMNERMDVEITPTDVLISAQHREVLQNVSNKVEQICGWELSILLDHIAKEYHQESAGYKDLVMWVTNEVKKYFQGEVSLKDNSFESEETEDKLAVGMMNVELGMIVEKIVRRLRGLSEDDEPIPTYIKKMEDVVGECLPNDDEEEE